MEKNENEIAKIIVDACIKVPFMRYGLTLGSSLLSSKPMTPEQEQDKEAWYRMMSAGVDELIETPSPQQLGGQAGSDADEILNMFSMQQQYSPYVF